jgi:hypothetical protein
VPAAARGCGRDRACVPEHGRPALRFARALALALAAGTAIGCRSFATPRPETLASVAPMPLAALVPGRFVLELATPGLTGVFDGVCAVEAASFRVQLFPDVGGKVLDVVVGAAAVTGEMPGSRYEARAPLEGAPPHLALAVAALFAELLAPVDAARVLGERDIGGAVEVELRPALGSGRVEALLASSGAVARYRITLGWIDLVLDADGRIDGARVAGRLSPPGG